MNILLSKNPKNLSYKDIIWDYLNEQALKHMSKGEMVSYKLNTYFMYKLAMEKEKYDLAFNLICEVIAYDLSGMDDYEFTKYRSEILYSDVAPYDSSIVVIPSWLVKYFASLLTKLNLSGKELEARLLERFNSFRLKRTVFTVRESVEIILAELNGDYDKLRSIYKIVAKRQRKYL